jgi:transposase
LSSKIHVVVDACGLPVRMLLTPGQASDETTFPALVEGLALARDVIADRGFFARAIIELIEGRGAKAHIPSQRNVFRRIATRYDKLARNFLAAVLLASSRLWIRAYESTT